MKIAIAAFEYGSRGSGIARVAGAIGDELAMRGHTIIPVAPGHPETGFPADGIRWGGLDILRFWKRARRVLRKLDYDVAWLHQPLYRGTIGHPSVTTVHTTYEGHAAPGRHSLAKQSYFRTMRLLERRAFLGLETNHWTAIDPQVIAELAAIGVPRASIQLVGNGVDLAKFVPASDKAVAKRDVGLPDYRPLIVSVGRLAPVKRPLLVLDAYTNYQQAGGRAGLVFVGDGPLRAVLEAEVQRRQLESVRITGFVQDSPIGYLRAGDIFVIASEYEGQPLAVLEALAAGLPVLAHPIPNLRFLEAYDVGLLADFEDPRASSVAMRELVDEAVSQRKRCVRARHLAETRFDWSKVAVQYERLLASAAKGGA